jgi:N-acetylmuramoyl-L-alanine amidase
MTIILDNGHGYNTPGKRSPIFDGEQLFEWEFNRDIVHRIAAKLDFKHIPYYILVPEAVDIPLRTRCSRANRIHKDNPDCFLISIHGNAGGGKGWEVWTSPGETESDKIATIFFKEAKLITPHLRSDYSDGDPDKESRFFILTGTTCPAILTENLFYDNEKECRFMLSDIGRERIAEAHARAIYKYLKSKQNGPEKPNL